MRVVLCDGVVEAVVHDHGEDRQVQRLGHLVAGGRVGEQVASRRRRWRPRCGPDGRAWRPAPPAGPSPGRPRAESRNSCRARLKPITAGSQPSSENRIASSGRASASWRLTKAGDIGGPPRRLGCRPGRAARACGVGAPRAAPALRRIAGRQRLQRLAEKAQARRHIAGQRQIAREAAHRRRREQRIGAELDRRGSRCGSGCRSGIQGVSPSTTSTRSASASGGRRDRSRHASDGRRAARSATARTRPPAGRTAAANCGEGVRSRRRRRRRAG